MLACVDALKQTLQKIPDLELAVLVGSRVQGTATPQSDWDIAIRWQKHIQGLERHEHAENLRQRIMAETGIHPEQIDLIEMTSARLAMRALIAEEGVLLVGDNTLAWSHFLLQTWAELEDYYWRKQHAA